MRPELRIQSLIFFFFNDTATTEIYTLSLHDALPISTGSSAGCWGTHTASALANPMRWASSVRRPDWRRATTRSPSIRASTATSTDTSTTAVVHRWAAIAAVSAADRARSSDVAGTQCHGPTVGVGSRGTSDGSAITSATAGQDASVARSTPGPAATTVG